MYKFTWFHFYNTIHLCHIFLMFMVFPLLSLFLDAAKYKVFTLNIRTPQLLTILVLKFEQVYFTS